MPKTKKQSYNKRIKKTRDAMSVVRSLSVDGIKRRNIEPHRKSCSSNVNINEINNENMLPTTSFRKQKSNEITPKKDYGRDFMNTTLLEIIVGDFSQFSDEFPNPKTQCTAMAASALAYMSLKSVILWNANDLNIILRAGQTYYENSLSYLLQINPQYNHTHLEPSHLLKYLELDSHVLEVFIESMHCGGGPHIEGVFVNAIYNFEQCQFESGIIVYEGYSFGLIRFNNSNDISSYAFFDSHGRLDDGNKPGTKSALLFFKNAEDFIKFFLHENPLLQTIPNCNNISGNIILAPLRFLDITDEKQGSNSKLFNKMYSLLERSPLINVISGAFAQNNMCFNINSRNKQCTANSVVFLAFASIIKENWTCLDINSILMLGDSIYSTSYSEAIRLKPRDHPFLAAHEIKKEICIEINHLDFDKVCVLCHPIIKKEYSGNFGRFAQEYIERFFTNYSDGVFICCDRSFALHKFKEKYLLFDPHARSKDGFLQPNGTANIFFFSSVEFLFEFLRRFDYNKTREFTLTPFLISRNNKTNDTCNILATISDQTAIQVECGVPILSNIVPIIDETNDMWDSNDDIPLIEFRHLPKPIQTTSVVENERINLDHLNKHEASCSLEIVLGKEKNCLNMQKYRSNMTNQVKTEINTKQLVKKRQIETEEQRGENSHEMAKHKKLSHNSGDDIFISPSTVTFIDEINDMWDSSDDMPLIELRDHIKSLKLKKNKNENLISGKSAIRSNTSEIVSRKEKIRLNMQKYRSNMSNQVKTKVKIKNAMKKRESRQIETEDESAQRLKDMAKRNKLKRDKAKQINYEWPAPIPKAIKKNV